MNNVRKEEMRHVSFLALCCWVIKCFDSPCNNAAGPGVTPDERASP